MKKWIAIALVLLVIATTPYIASTPIGKPIFLFFLGSRLNTLVTAEKVSLSWTGPQKLYQVSFSGSEVTGKIGYIETDLPFWKLEKMKRSFQIENGTFIFPTLNQLHLVNVNAKVLGATVFIEGETSRGGSLQIQGKILTKEHFDIIANLKEIPTILIDRYFTLNHTLYNTLGPLTSVKGLIAYQNGDGKVVCDLTATHCGAIINGTIGNDVLTLDEPLLATLQITDTFSEMITQKFSNHLLSKINSHNPIILRIFTHDFKLPLKPFNISMIQIGSGMIDLGQIQVTSGETLHLLMKYFKDRQFHKEIPIWLTPAPFSIYNQTLDIGRVDALLSHSIHLCTWGKIDLPKERLDMYLGLPQDTIESAFGIRNLPENYLLRIPITGPIKNPQFDTGPVVAKIASMAASQQISGLGGPVLGGILKTITHGRNGDDAPPPNRPFPWEQ